MWLLVPCASAKRGRGGSISNAARHVCGNCSARCNEKWLPFSLVVQEVCARVGRTKFRTLVNFVRRYLYSRVGVLFDPLDDGLVDQLLGLCVQAVVGQIGYQVVLGDAEDLFLPCHLKKKDSIAKKLFTLSDTI